MITQRTRRQSNPPALGMACGIYGLMDEHESAEQPAPVISLALARYWRNWMRCTCCSGTGGIDADVFGEVVITCDLCLGTGVVLRPKS
jgi:hypothetical protein